MELVDTHAHLNFPAFQDDLEEVLKRATEEGVKTIINVGTDLFRSTTAVGLAQKYPFIFATTGIHPTDSPEINIDQEIKVLKKLVKSPKVVAVGECGLDFYREENESERKRQIELFQAQIQIAIDQDLPLIVHSREAWSETLQAVKDSGIKRGVFHSWTYDPQITKQALKQTDFYFSCNGIITFKNAGHLLETFKLIPLERLLLETDCPFLTPVPHRGLRNEPSFVKIVADTIAHLKDTTAETIAQKSTDNAKKIFKL